MASVAIHLSLCAHNPEDAMLPVVLNMSLQSCPLITLPYVAKGCKRPTHIGPRCPQEDQEIPFNHLVIV